MHLTRLKQLLKESTAKSNDPELSRAQRLRYFNRSVELTNSIINTELIRAGLLKDYQRKYATYSRMLDIRPAPRAYRPY